MDPSSAVTLIILSALVGMTIIFIVKNKLYFLEEKKNAFVKSHIFNNAFQGIKDIKMSQSENYFKINLMKYQKLHLMLKLKDNNGQFYQG